MILLCAGFAFAQDDNASIGAEREGIRVGMTAGTGAVITMDGLPFVNASTFFVVKKDWKGRWFGYPDAREAVSKAKRSKTPDGGDRFDMTFSSPDNIVVTSQSLELLPGRVVRLGVDVLVTTTTHASFEHQMGGMNPAWVAGRPFTVSGPDAKTSFTVAPAVAKQAEMLGAAIASHFDKMTIDTRMGPLEIIAKGGVKPCVLDYRAHKYALTPHYWIGILEHKLTPNEVLSYSVEFRFPPARAAAAKRIEVDAKPRDEARVLARLEMPDRIFPTPKKVAWSKSNFSLNVDTTIRIEAANSDEIQPAADGFINFVKKNFGVTLKMSEMPSPKQIVLSCKDGSVSVTEADNQEQYVVKIGDTVSASANTSAGLMNAVKTLQQLVRGEGDKISMRGCEIEDWPAMPYRGIHFFSGKDARELQLKMVRDILGALKINNICYQSEYVMWDATSKVHHEKYGMSKEDARAVVEECVRQGIEITPLINLFGHSEWLIANKVYRHLADNPNHPYAYDPSNPEVYELTEKILIEVLDFFKPNVLHIGHDEITMEGFPNKEANKEVGTTELILRDIMHYYDFLHARGVRTMLWGDLFIGPGEADDAAHAPDVETSTLRRDRLPKDVIITDWHYSPAPVEKHPSLKMFNDAGFDALACPWFDPVNVVNFTRAAGLQWEATKDVKNEEGNPRKGQTLGILDTTWAGYSFGQESFDENQDQYAAYFLAAEASWTGAEKSYDKWDFDYRTEFARMWSGSDLPRGERAGWTIDLGKAVNFTAVAGEKKDFLGNVGVSGMENLPVGKQPLGRFTYEIQGEKGSPEAVLLAGKMNPEGEWPAAITIPIGRSAASIGFAAAATLAGPTHPPIARTVVTFDDGTTDTFDWKLGQTIFAVDDPRVSATSLAIWKDTPVGEPAKVLHQYVWRNPTPDKKVRSVRIESNQQASGLILFAMSGTSAR
ncbi:hypothetical protein CVU37_11250 [candidate division BRC1 bacterium HGW-BRC1-1]|nr:MAG: hypothetical protein CVU37_11250 [candidate division BRC1 bacterium HGW-BRC1-1]